jgi:hypothetical protein
MLVNKAYLLIRSFQLKSTQIQVKVIKNLEDIKIYPNPLLGEILYVEDMPAFKEFGLKIYDISGNLVLNRDLRADEEGKTCLSLKDLASGIYLIILKDKTSQKLMKLAICR